MFDLKKFFRKHFGTQRTIRMLRSGSEPQAISYTLDAAALSDVLRSAEGGNMRDYFSLCRDIIAGHGHTQAEFAKRKRGVLNETQTLAPKNKEAPGETELARALAAHLDEIPEWQTVLGHLMGATLYPVSVVEKVFRPSDKPGWRYEIAQLIPVPYHLLDFSKRGLHIFRQTETGESTGESDPVDLTRYIVHRGHLLTEVPDTWGGPFRAVVFWWLFATQGRDWWARFLDRFGSPFLEGQYDPNDDESRVSLESAFSAASRLLGVVVPNETRVQVHAVNTQSGGDAFEKFHAVANREISKIIVGQTMSSEAQTAGFGGGQAGLQGDVLEDLRKFDATQLAACIRSQLLVPLCALNGWTTPAPTIWWGASDSAEEQTVSADILRSLRDAGLEITDDGIGILSRRIALPLRRAASPAPGPGLFSAGLRPLAAVPRLTAAPDPTAAIDKIAASQADAFALAMARGLAPLSRVVAASTSLADLEARLMATLPGVSPDAAAELALACLTGGAANAAVNFPDPIR